MKRFFLKFGQTVALLVITSLSFGQLSADTAARLDDLFAGRSMDEPGGVLKITRHGKQIYKKVFGVTNLQQPTPINSATVFVAASVTKQFTAAGILLLQAEGRLSLEDDVRKYVPELPDYGKEITLKHLLTHTSGLKDWWNVTYITTWHSGRRVFDQRFALHYIASQKTLNYAPGERYSYTNAGYDLASIIIERITGETFPDFIEKRFLKPAGMDHSLFPSRFDQVIPNMSTGYYTSGSKFVTGLVLDETYGAAGLLTTAGDLNKWNQFIHHSSTGKKLAQYREERFVLNNGDTIDYANGGVNVTRVNGVKEITHSGLNGGYRALCTYYPEKGLSVTYVSNNKDISTVDLRNNIAEIFFGNDKKQDILSALLAREKTVKKKIPADELQNKTGVFLNVTDESDFLKLHLNGNDLMSYAAVLEQHGRNVFTYGSNVYHFLPAGDTVHLYRAADKAVFYRVDSFNPDQQFLTNFTGTFYSGDADVTLQIRKVDNRLIAYRPAGDSVVLAPVFQLGNRFAFRGFDHGLRATYFFEKNEGKPVSNLTISLPRANGIPFHRKTNEK